MSRRPTPLRRWLTEAEARQAVDDMLLCCQKLRSNSSETILQAAGYEAAAKVERDLYPWLHPPKDIRPLLIDIQQGKKPLDPLGIFNLMFIAHTLCPAIGAIAPLRLRGGELPTVHSKTIGEGWRPEDSIPRDAGRFGR